MAVHLHEDYEAQGCYCYELNQNTQLKLADKFLDAAASFIPRDTRRTIDGRRANNGVIQRRRVPSLPGLPEAVALYMHSTTCTLTFETPSVFSLTDRVAAHSAFLDAVWTHHLSEA